MSEKKRESSSSSSDSDSDSSDSSSSSSSNSSSSSSSSLSSKKSSVSNKAGDGGTLSNSVNEKNDASNEKTVEKKRSPERKRRSETPETPSLPQEIKTVEPVEKTIAESSESLNHSKSAEKDDTSPKPTEKRDMSPKSTETQGSSPKTTEKDDSNAGKSKSRSQSPVTEKRPATPDNDQEKEEGEITMEKSTNDQKYEREDHGKRDRRVDDKNRASRRSRERRRKRSRSRSRSRSLRKRRSHNRSRDRSRNRSRNRSRDRSRDRSRNRSRDRSRNRSRNRDDRYRRKQRSKSKTPEKTNPETIPKKQQKAVDILTSKTGGAYIPPAKLRALQAEITDKSSAAFQRIAWEALKKSIHGFINKVNVDNIGIITRQLLKENIVRGRGLLCRSIIQAQAASPTFTHVYAALVSVINSKFPNIGELLLHRLVIQFKRGFRRNDKPICISATRFIAHLINQRVAHEILALEILTLLVEMPTDDSVEVAIAFLKECGMKLQEVSAKGVNAIFEMLKNILHEGKLDKRVQYMIEVVFQVRKDGFKVQFYTHYLVDIFLTH